MNLNNEKISQGDDPTQEEEERLNSENIYLPHIEDEVSDDETSSLASVSIEFLRGMRGPKLSVTLPISQDEKTSISSYFAAISQYIYPEDLPYLNSFITDGKIVLPSGTKISRPKSELYGENIRLLILPGRDIATNTLAMTNLLSFDPMQHSCTMIDGELYFHAPIKPLDNEEEAYFLKGVAENHVVYNSIKPCVRSDGERFVLNSSTSHDPSCLSYSSSQIMAKVGIYAGHDNIFRKNNFGAQKVISVSSYFGPTLADVLDELHSFSPEKSETLAWAILYAYFEQVYFKGIVHTDIKPANICISNFNEPFEITFIDHKESFCIGEKSNGLGTVGYYSHEFFKHPENAAVQLKLLRENGPEFFYKDIVVNKMREQFSPASDIYALGQTIQDCTNLKPGSDLFNLVQTMTQKDGRISADEIAEYIFTRSGKANYIPNIYHTSIG